RRRPVRVAHQAQRRRQGQFGAPSGPRRRARSDRQPPVCRARVLRLPQVLRVIRLAILGSTGSIGRSALSVVAAHPDRLRVVVLAAGENSELLAVQVRQVRPEAVALASDSACGDLRERLAGVDVEILPAGPDGLLAAATWPDVDVVLCASSGTAGLEAALLALGQGRRLALAHKVVLVMAGALIVDEARRHGAAILPVDSEHTAIHQSLDGHRTEDVRRLILTASGGPFRTFDDEALARVTPADALRH